MAENPLFDRLIQQLATTNDPAEKAAIIAESSFDQQPADVALVARRCIILRWFDETILAALLPGDATLSAAAAAERLATFAFVEHLPWGLAYHDQTRSGLLARYAKEKPDLLQQAAALAAPAYLNHADPKIAGPEALFSLIVAGEAGEATEQLNRLIDDLGDREDWNGLLALFTACDQAAMFSFVTPLQRTAFHRYASGVALAQLGNLKEAIVAYQQSIALDEKYIRSWNGLGNVYYNQKLYVEAVSAYQQAIVLDEKYANPWNGLGNVYSEQKQYREAIAAYKQAIALDEKYAHPWNNLGIVYRDQRRYEEAIAAYRQAIVLDEKYALPWNGLGNVHSNLEHYAEAIAAYQHAIALDDKYASPWNGLGNVYSDQKQYEEAIVAYQQAISLDDKSASPWNGLGNVYSEQKRYAEAIAAYQQAITLQPEAASTYSQLGSTLRLLGRWTEAEKAIRQSVALDPTDWPDWFVLADIMLRQGDQQAWRTALAQAQPLVDYTDLYNAACFESVAGNVERALELLTEATADGQLDPAWAREDPDLHWVRHDPRFWALIDKT